MPSTLVTGGAGYIGSHVATALASHGRRFVVLDNLVNSSARVIERVAELVGAPVDFHEGDIRDGALVRKIALDHDVDAVIHMAGLKAVGESVEQPLRYYDNNVGGTLAMLQALQDTPVRKIVFSSSATVYGAAERMPIDESAPTAPASPYGMTKLMIEHILRDVVAGDASWRVVNLRYFNPVGAHESGRIGENPAGVPNNVMPFITQVAAGRLERLRVFGNDYPTVDGTGVRDFIHVMDLAEGHVAALEWLGSRLRRNGAGSDSGNGAGSGRGNANLVTVNLGTGRGYSVLELLRAFERTTGVKVAHTIVQRRPGDIAMCFADPSLAKRVLGWEARRGIDDMCRDAWRWQSSNPDGY